MERKIDLSTEHGARTLAAALKQYWRSRGSTAIYADPIPVKRAVDRPDHLVTLWGVQTNLVNGFPPDCRSE